MFLPAKTVTDMEEERRGDGEGEGEGQEDAPVLGRLLAEARAEIASLKEQIERQREKSARVL